MKNFRQLVQELPSKKVVMAFGRFQPPTTGHELLVNAVKKIAQNQDADHIIFASKSQDKKSNPLSVDRKVYYLKRMFPKTNFVAANDRIRTFMEAAAELSKKYKHLVMLAGSDRVNEYKKLLQKYNGDVFTFETIEVVSAGERDPDADTASGMSGTKMREAAKKGDYSTFKKGLPHTLTDLDGKRLMNEIRQGMGLDVIKEQVKFEVSELREKYHAGEIFNLEEIVESNGIVYQIKKRGSNHLLLQDEAGNLVSKWLQDVEQTTKEFKLQEGHISEMKFSSTDKIKVARVIATALGIEDVEKSSNPEQLVNNALRKIRSKPMRPEYISVLHNMLQTAKEADIKYDEKLVPTKVDESRKINIKALMKKISVRDVEGVTEPEDDKDNESDIDAEAQPQAQDSTEVGHSIAPNEAPQQRRMKIAYVHEETEKEESEEHEDQELEKELDSITDKEIDNIVDKIEDEDDIIDAYEDDELSLVDDDTGEHVDEVKDDVKEEVINEVLSRMERMKAKARFARTKAKRERRVKIALKSRSSSETINKRARKLAIQLMKKRLARKPLNQLSISEKERIERVVSKRKAVINRLAMKLAPKVRKIETTRLTHKSYTK